MNLGGASLLYLSLYLVTLACHLFLAGTVVIGTILAAGVLWRPGASAAARELAAALRSWLPFLLGLAVTIGVAPLLFVQVLYQESFYSANLLLVTRFFALVPLLMIGFYLLYLGKGAFLHLEGRRASAALLVAAACFVFIAATWSENHLLSLEPARWPEVYLHGQAAVHAAALARLCVFFGVAILCTALLLSYLVAAQRRLCALMIAPGVLVLALGFFWWHASAGDVAVPPSAPLRYACCVLLVLLSAAWLLRFRRPGAPLRHGRAVLTFALLLMVLVVREEHRLAGMDLAEMAARHRLAFAHAGSWLFGAFLLGNAALIAWCVALVRRSLGRPA